MSSSAWSLGYFTFFLAPLWAAELAATLNCAIHKGTLPTLLVSLHGSKSAPLPPAPWNSRYASLQRKLELCAGATGARSEPRSRWHEATIAAAQESIHRLDVRIGLRLSIRPNLSNLSTQI